MHSIKIILKENVNAELDFFLDGSELTPQMHDNLIVLSVDSDAGLHLLSLHNKSSQKIEISDVEVDGSSLSHLLYMSWLIDENGKKYQPATAS